MKRIFIVALCAALAVCAIAVPVSASVYEERWTNVLDYATVNDNGSNVLSVTSGQLFTLQLPGNTVIQDIDILFRLGTAPTSVKAIRDDGMEFPLTVMSLGSGLYRAYGNCQGYGFNRLGFKITFNSTGTSYGQLLQCRISTQPVDFYNVTASISKDAHVNGPSKHTAASQSTIFSFTSTGDWFVSFDIDKWQGYDFIDFSFTAKGITIGSISAKIGDRSIDVVVESFDGDPSIADQKLYTGYLDIYGVDHQGSNTLELYITGTCPSTSGANLWLAWLNGTVKIDSPSIFALIWQSIKSGFTSVGEWLSNGFNSVVNAITGSFDGLKQEQGQTNDKLDNITDHEPVPEQPDWQDSVNEYEEAEKDALDKVQTGMNDASLSFDNALVVLGEYIGSFAALSVLFNSFADIPFFSALLAVSLSLGIVAAILGMGLDAARYSARSTARSTRKARSR